MNASQTLWRKVKIAPRNDFWHWVIGHFLPKNRPKLMTPYPQCYWVTMSSKMESYRVKYIIQKTYSSLQATLESLYSFHGVYLYNGCIHIKNGRYLFSGIFFAHSINMNVKRVIITWTQYIYIYIYIYVQMWCMYLQTSRIVSRHCFRWWIKGDAVILWEPVMSDFNEVPLSSMSYVELIPDYWLQYYIFIHMLKWYFFVNRWRF